MLLYSLNGVASSHTYSLAGDQMSQRRLEWLLSVILTPNILKITPPPPPFTASLLGNSIESANIEHLSRELIFELAGIKLGFKGGKNLLVLGTYRPPDASLEDALTSLSSTLEVLLPGNNGICILGDFKCRFLVSRINRTQPWALSFIQYSQNNPPCHKSLVHQSLQFT